MEIWKVRSVIYSKNHKNLAKSSKTLLQNCCQPPFYYQKRFNSILQQFQKQKLTIYPPQTDHIKAKMTRNGLRVKISVQFPPKQQDHSLKRRNYTLNKLHYKVTWIEYSFLSSSLLLKGKEKANLVKDFSTGIQLWKYIQKGRL